MSIAFATEVRTVASDRMPAGLTVRHPAEAVASQESGAEPQPPAGR